MLEALVIIGAITVSATCIVAAGVLGTLYIMDHMMKDF